MEGFVEFWRPIVAFGFGRVFAFLVAKVRTNQVHFYERSEHPIGSPLDVISCNNYNQNIITPLANWCYFQLK